MTHPGALRRAVGRGKRVTVNPASGSDCYVVATVRSLCCTVALLAVLVLALASACVPSCMVTVDCCAGISPSVQRRRALNWVGLPWLGVGCRIVYLRCAAMSFHAYRP